MKNLKNTVCDFICFSVSVILMIIMLYIIFGISEDKKNDCVSECKETGLSFFKYKEGTTFRHEMCICISDDGEIINIY